MDLQEFENKQIAVIAPLRRASVELKAYADAALITTDDDLKDATNLKTSMNSHSKRVKELRLSLTRPLDEVTSQLIAKEREVLAPLEEAKQILSLKMISYTEERERALQVEVERIATIAARVESLYSPGLTEGQVATARKQAKQMMLDMPEDDKDRPAIKIAFLTLSNKLITRSSDLEVERQRAQKQKLLNEEAQLAQERRELELAKERERLERAKLEADKEALRAEQQRPKANIAEVTEFEIVDPDAVDRALCSPDNKKIRQAILAGATTIEGVRIFKTKKVR